MGKNIKFLIAGAVLAFGALAYLGYKHRDLLMLDDDEDWGDDYEDEDCGGSCCGCCSGCNGCANDSCDGGAEDEGSDTGAGDTEGEVKLASEPFEGANGE